MKKILFLLLILAGAVYWGFSSGSELTKNVVHEHVKPHAAQKATPKDASPSEEKGIVTEISDTVRTLISGLSSSETKEGSVETLPPKPDAKSPVDGAEQLLTAKEKMDNVLHFRKALEARVHREEFVPFAEIPDRRQAIYYALAHAQPGDIIAILGKGHETTIERGGIKEPFVEREIVEEYWGR